MNVRKLIYLTGFISLIITLVAVAMANQTTIAGENRKANSLPAPQPVAVPAPIQATPKTTPAAQPAPAASFIAPEPVPTPGIVMETVVPHPANTATRIVLPVTLILFTLCALAAWLKRQWATPEPHLRQKRIIGQGIVGLFCVSLLGCQSTAADPLPPDQYLDNALSWMEANAVTADSVDWTAVRAEAEVLAPNPQTTADTYPAIRYAQEQLDDYLAFLHLPEQSVWEREAIGLTAVYPQNIVVEIETGSPAAAAVVQVGDRVLAINGAPPLPDDDRPRHVDFQFDPENPAPVMISLERGGEQWQVTLVGENFENLGRPAAKSFALEGKTAAYLDLLTDVGTRMYPTHGQAAIAEVDGADTCGWIIDLRRNKGGNLWTYFATLSPILGEGELGGFVYTDGSREMWTLRDGKVFWAEEEREESYVRGPVYELERPWPPVALLISPLTEAAGELIVVAFRGWGSVRTFGEPTLGAPHLVLHTPLSGGALLFVSGARGMDRNGNVYNGPITPDEPVTIDWQRLGDTDDPVISAALGWLTRQPACRP
jgi:carboxyl-terminal processing protease